MKHTVLEAATLKRWLSQVYPPGMMERTNPRTIIMKRKSLEREWMPFERAVSYVTPRSRRSPLPKGPPRISPERL